MNKLLTALIVAAVTLTSTACSTNVANQPAVTSATLSSNNTTVESVSLVDTSSLNSEDLTAEISLEGSSIRVVGGGVSVDGTTATITAAGVYRLSGSLDNGQIIVETEDEGTVELILDNAVITNTSSAPIFVSSAEEVVITLADGSSNTVTDGASYVFADAETEEPDAAIFSKSDLVIGGSGSLTVNASYKNGIASKDSLTIENGIITVNAIADGIKGKDSVTIQDGTLTIVSGSDGIQSTNDTDEEKGTVTISGGTINITAGLDGIQAETGLLIGGGNLTIVTGGGSANSSTQAGWGNPGSDSTTTESMKALKAGVDLTVSGGSINIDSEDDALHSNGSLTIDGGELTIASGDDGVHADTSLVINNGSLNITKSYEGLESAAITLNGGTIYVTSSDDAINVAGGSDGSAMGGRPGQNNFSDGGNYTLTINGGTIVLDAGGDGLDSNGTISMTDGVVIVNGPTNNGNGPVDYMGSFNISGGFLVAVGSSGMAQATSSDSSQYAVLYNYDSAQSADTLISILNQAGESILTFAPSKQYQSVLFSSADIQNGATYTLTSGGSASGTAQDGLYENGTVSGAGQVTSFTISSIVTSLGTASNMMGGGGGGRGGPGGGGGGGMQPPAQ
ncbi:carbohydrate-binding domain-containing protein [Pelolinea submarina]|uniref:Uncharacterized protein DUF4353 n=1 Tax=Pelolinea submarina TaxID=913107 RepID=A0A347ZRP9_9CHLR|nr:carbohydrate-binding domain-containing protein [Pelolinea submarina]REG11466.1 uncharacterized protein DUF4353 [Pelolinea submarina]BBB47980.1 hypothetical protein Pelsub_P1208 [Pelolinea submarina]